jgi:hypothetical protein
MEARPDFEQTVCVNNFFFFHSVCSTEMVYQLLFFFHKTTKNFDSQ